MNYCIVEDGIITNRIVCDNNGTAEELGALPDYPGADIGKPYDPPKTYTADDLFAALLGTLARESGGG